MRRPRLVVDQRELTEMRAGFEHTEDHLATIVADEHDFDPTRAEQVKRIAGIVLKENDTSFRIRSFPHELTEFGELVAVEPAKERDAGEKIGGLSDHTADPLGNQ